MIVASILISLALGVTCNDPYVRTRADNSTCTTPNSSAHCLWWPGGTTVTFHQSTAGNPATDNTNTAVFAAVTRSWQTWQGIMTNCGSLTINEGDQTADRTVGYDQSSPSSNINSVLFRQRQCDSTVVPTGDPCKTSGTCGNVYDCWDHGTSVIALTTTTYDRNTGKILDADVELNGQAPSGTGGFKFTVVDSPPCPTVTAYNCVAADIQNTVTHEFGHSLGLDHTMYPIFDPCMPGCTSMSYTHSTMYAQAPTGDLCKRCVDSGSRQFICDVYPKNRAAQDCLGNGSTGGGGSSSGCSAAPGGPMLVLASLSLRALRRRRSRRIS